MKNRSIYHKAGSRLGTLVLMSVIAITMAALIGASYTLAAVEQEGRARRSEQAKPTPTPAPASRSGSTPNQPATTAPASIPTSTPTPIPRATPTQTPANVIDRIIPQLGEPPPPPVLKPKPTPTPPEDYGEGDIVKVDTELVTLNVRVIDRNNRPIDNVKESDFHVFEDGVEQPVAFFSTEEIPVSYGLAVDNSGSLRSQLQSVIDAGKTIINSNKRGDETFLVRFISSDKIETVQDFTENMELLLEALDNMYVEGGQTAVIDAVFLSAERVAEYKKGDDNDRRRRALIVVTDGEDRDSFYKQEQLFARLREADVQIYVIGFVSELDKDGGFIRKSSRDKAVSLLTKLASETGGRAFFPGSISELPRIANEIVRDLRTQYVLAYNPTNKARDGSYRAIRVAVSDSTGRDKRIALTRGGRIAPKVGLPAPLPAKPATRTTTARPRAASTTKTP
ncbi:MAG: VWA domain-containing protein [Acidobacteriota bacterium]|nr:VWA domain-containing protein [Acidobacteriota bacterium]